MPGSIHESATADAPIARAAEPASARWTLPVEAWRAVARFVRRKPLGAASAVIIGALDPRLRTR